MRIAEISPLIESVPPEQYGGTERIVSYLTEEFVRMGHQVTLLASGDSHTSANLIPICRESLRHKYGAGSEKAASPLHLLAVETLLEHTSEFDVAHFHIDCLHLPLLEKSPLLHATTVHNRIDAPGVYDFLIRHSEAPIITISDYQRSLGPPEMNWEGTVPHGLPLDLYKLNKNPADYLAFLGRISREKRVDRAIEIAARLDMPLRIASKIDYADQQYFDEEIKPLTEQAQVEFIGEVSDEEKQEFLGNARALLFPIDWPEPFGLVMIEAMACGTPTVAFRCGAVPEVLENGVTGYIVDNLDAAVDATRSAMLLDRSACRQHFEARFSARRMAEDYVNLFQRLIDRNQGEGDELSSTAQQSHQFTEVPRYR